MAHSYLKFEFPFAIGSFERGVRVDDNHYTKTWRRIPGVLLADRLLVMTDGTWYVNEAAIDAAGSRKPEEVLWEAWNATKSYGFALADGYLSISRPHG